MQRVNGPGLSAFLGYVLRKSLQQFIHTKKRWGHQRHGTWLREALPFNADHRQAPLVPHAESAAAREHQASAEACVHTRPHTTTVVFSSPRVTTRIFPFEILGISSK